MRQAVLPVLFHPRLLRGMREPAQGFEGDRREPPPGRRRAAPDAPPGSLVPPPFPGPAGRAPLPVGAAGRRFPDALLVFLPARGRRDRQPALRAPSAGAGKRLDGTDDRRAGCGDSRLGGISTVRLEALPWGLRERSTPFPPSTSWGSSARRGRRES